MSVCLCVLVAQSCPIVCDSIYYSPSGSSVHGVLQARILEWVAIPYAGGILLTQGSNLGLLHCRRMLYRLSYEGSPKFTRAGFYFKQLRRLAGIEIGGRNGY